MLIGLALVRLRLLSLSLLHPFSVSVFLPHFIRVCLSVSCFRYVDTPVVGIARNCDVLLAIIALVLEIALIRGRVKDRFRCDD